MTDILIHEVGLRDGLQVEKDVVPFEKKAEWLKKLIKSNVDIIQAGSFVHPVKVPQMADTDKLFTEFSKEELKPKNIILSGLVLNEKGMERGINCGVDMFCMGVSASNTHSRKNTGMGTEEALTRIIAMGKSGIEAGKKVQVSVQSAFGCGFEGMIPEENVLKIVKKFLENGLKAISLADTAGHANPKQVEGLFSAILELDKDVILACHFHNTYGMGLANAYAAYKSGVKYFESAFAGLGGCPFTAVTGGNIATEDLLHMFERMNIPLKADIETIIDLAKDAETFFGRELPGVIHKTGKIPEVSLTLH